MNQKDITKKRNRILRTLKKEAEKAEKEPNKAVREETMERIEKARTLLKRDFFVEIVNEPTILKDIVIRKNV